MHGLPLFAGQRRKPPIGIASTWIIRRQQPEGGTKIRTKGRNEPLLVNLTPRAHEARRFHPLSVPLSDLLKRGRRRRIFEKGHARLSNIEQGAEDDWVLRPDQWQSSVRAGHIVNHLKGVPVVFLTGHPTDAERQPMVGTYEDARDLVGAPPIGLCMSRYHPLVTGRAEAKGRRSGRRKRSDAQPEMIAAGTAGHGPNEIGPEISRTERRIIRIERSPADEGGDVETPIARQTLREITKPAGQIETRNHRPIPKEIKGGRCRSWIAYVARVATQDAVEHLIRVNLGERPESHRSLRSGG
jgi:hypothetical protein